jgi:hypothetical protein
MSNAMHPSEYMVEDHGYVTPCWIWMRAKGKHGYGICWKDGRTCRAHRVVYERHKGPIPDGKQLDHLCRIRCCVNPSHLEPVSGAINIRRSPVAKFTQLEIDEIRRIYTSKGGCKEIAALFGTTHGYISQIVRGARWR